MILLRLLDGFDRDTKPSVMSVARCNIRSSSDERHDSSDADFDDFLQGELKRRSSNQSQTKSEFEWAPWNLTAFGDSRVGFAFRDGFNNCRPRRALAVDDLDVFARFRTCNGQVSMFFAVDMNAVIFNLRRGQIDG